MKKTFIILALLLFVGWLIAAWQKPPANPLSDLVETIPDQELKPESRHPLITVSSPRPGELITAPFTVTGQARGPWYFEATFPITLVNEAGEVITNTFATAEKDWMTEDFVPFSAELTFPPPEEVVPAQIIFHKANPSGLNEQADSFSQEIYLTR